MTELKPLEPHVINNGVKVIKIDPAAKYIVFIDRSQIDPDAFSDDPENPLPAGTPVWAVDNVTTAIKIYELLDTHPVFSKSNGH